jgi:hypothetical protein
MSMLEQSRKHALACLRLESECMQLASEVRDPILQSHFLRASEHWSTLAVSGPDASPDEDSAKANVVQT